MALIKREEKQEKKHMADPAVTLSDINIPFGRMVLIILKWMLASIPAMILMWLIMIPIMLLFGGFGALLTR